MRLRLTPRIVFAFAGLSVLARCSSGADAPGTQGSSGPTGTLSTAQGAGGRGTAGASTSAGSSTAATTGTGGTAGTGTSTATATTGTGGAVGSGPSTATSTGNGGGSSGGGRDGGSAGTAGAGAGKADGGAVSSSKIPVPPGPANVPKPSGAMANLAVLDWGGFKAALTYTFDDSQPSQIDHFADIEATGVPVTYYVTTVNAWYAGYDATWKKAFAGGSELGNHTVNHCYANLTCNSGSTALPTIGAEIDQATDYIKTKLGASDVYTMAYPFGDMGYRSAAQARFFLGRSAGPGATNGMVAAGDNTDPFLLPVIAAAGGEPAGKFDADVDSARTQGKWLIFLFHTLLPNAQNWYAGVDTTSVTGNIAHAKSLGDVWIDTLANVGAYWLGQKTLEAAAPTVSGAGTTWTWKLPAHFPPGRSLRVTVGGGTLKQGETTLGWNGHGYYEVALDAGSLSWSP